VSFDILRNDLGDSGEYVTDVKVDGQSLGACHPDGGDYDCTFFTCPFSTPTITSSSGTVALEIHIKGHSWDCDCDKSTWECSKESTVSGRTKMTAVGRFTFTSSLPTGAAPAAPTVSGVAATVSDEDGEDWIPVAKISDQNKVHRTTTAISGIKLSDAEITSLLKAGDGKLWLKCGNCNSYMQTSGEWCSDCKQSDGKHADQCALSPKGPFSNKGYNNCHAGSDCWKMSGSGAIYNDCGNNGCNCNAGGGGSGMLYVHGR